MYMYIHTYTYISLCLHIYIYIYTHTYDISIYLSLSLSLCIHTYIYTYIYIYTYVLRREYSRSLPEYIYSRRMDSPKEACALRNVVSRVIVPAEPQSLSIPHQLNAAIHQHHYYVICRTITYINNHYDYHCHLKSRKVFICLISIQLAWPRGMCNSSYIHIRVIYIYIYIHIYIYIYIYVHTYAVYIYTYIHIYM